MPEVSSLLVCACPVARYIDHVIHWRVQIICESALISEMTDFAHLIEYILLANLKLSTQLYTRNTRSFDRSLVNKITECCLLFFPQTWTQNHDFPIGTNVAKNIVTKRDQPIKNHHSSMTG